MSYEIELTRRAEKEVLALDDATYTRISETIDHLARHPRPSGVRKLKGRENEWRIRVGRQRILYSIDNTNHRILIHRVTDRKNAYDK